MRRLSAGLVQYHVRYPAPGRRRWLALAAITIAGARLASASGYEVIYRFTGGLDGYAPSAAMIAGPSGNLYGTTAFGGTSGACEGQAVQGCGTVFQLVPPATPGGTWTESVLYRFQGGSDGAFPEAAFIADAAGNLYGTTLAGGNSANCGGGCGTVFKLSRPATPGGDWSESLLHTFLGVPGNRNNGDAAQPNGIVFDPAGDLYGMAYGGGHCVTDETGTYCYGAVYKLAAPAHPAAAWTETILYTFRHEIPSGNPAGPILGSDGQLYGTAGWGEFGYGMVFRLTPSIPLAVPVYSFRGGSDGAFPNPGLCFDQAGNLYGSTFGGGPINSGTVYRLSPPSQPGGSWSESVLYGFTGGGDANTPNGSLVIGSSGNVYGATQYGGSAGVGAVFELSPPAAESDPWTENLLHSFAGGTDGQLPDGGLTLGANGALYGTTTGGGGAASSVCAQNGAPNSCGVVFQITP
jgi:uncharacterized repeat protein (TIGR03803 family)